MLKRLRLLLLVLIAISWFVFILPYLLVQTEFGSKYACKLISFNNDQYTVSFSRISHSLNTPYELTLDNITIQDKSGSITYLSAKKLVVGLKKNDLLQTHSFNYLLVENGSVELSPSIQMIDAQFLQLKNISVHYVSADHATEMTLKNIYGGAKPWSTKIMTERLDSQFNFTIQSVTYNQFNMQSIFVRGVQKNNILRLANLGGNINQGFFTANAMILPDNQIEISQLKLNNINYQSTIEPFDIHELFRALPKTSIRLLSVINSSISIPMLTIEKANLEAKNIRYNNGWQLQNSDLTFNAQSMVWHDELIEQPLLQWRHANDKIVVEQAIALWNKGNIRLSGSWQNDKLIIDNMIAGGIRYQLPSNWYQSLDALNLPEIIPQHIVVKQFMLMPSLLIDTTPKLPLQFSSFEAFGNDLEIDTSDNHFSINGSLLLKADNATINTVELKKLDLSMNLSSKNYALAFSTLTDQGILEGYANLSNSQQLEELILNAHTVDSQILSLWYLINNPIKTNKFTLELQGSLTPLSLNGELLSNGKNYPIKNNQLTGY